MVSQGVCGSKHQRQHNTTQNKTKQSNRQVITWVLVDYKFDVFVHLPEECCPRACPDHRVFSPIEESLRTYESQLLFEPSDPSFLQAKKSS